MVLDFPSYFRNFGSCDYPVGKRCPERIEILGTFVIKKFD
jgi:hypothetical protein